MSNNSICPCNSGKTYSSCCEPLLTCAEVAATAEDLMRSRYTAFVLHDSAYLLKTWHPSTRPPTISPASMSGWYGLQVIRTEGGGSGETHGVVEFTATIIRQRKICRFHENSRFVKENDQWLYLDGEIFESPPAISDKVGRNAPCPCGSRKKSKKCCAR